MRRFLAQALLRVSGRRRPPLLFPMDQPTRIDPRSTSQTQERGISTVT